MLFFTGLQFYDFMCCFWSLACLADGHVEGCTAKERGSRVGMNETVIRMRRKKFLSLQCRDQTWPTQLSRAICKILTANLFFRTTWKLLWVEEDKKDPPRQDAEADARSTPP